MSDEQNAQLDGYLVCVQSQILPWQTDAFTLPFRSRNKTTQF